ncbi:MAG: hypothetical protein JEZ04_04920 [Spirochaetales bacterium]|nr:hypothetical protein [Spirochaetales bacterium]
MAVPVFEVGPIDQNIIYAFAAGFLLAFIIFGIRILILKSRNRREVRDLRSSLINRLDLESASLNGMKKEIEDLRVKNSNLKTSMNSLSGKPGRREKLQLQVYQSAIEKMSVRAPGFAPAWHIVLRECEQEAGRSLDGTIPFINRIVPAVGTGWADNSVQPQDGFPAVEISADSELSGKSNGSGRSGTKKSLIGKIFGSKG